MKKLLLTAAVLAVAAAWGTDLNPNAGRAQGMGIQGIIPHCQVPSFLWGRGDVCPDMGYVDMPYDNQCWNYRDPELPGMYQPYLYMIFKFYKPTGYNTGSLRWRVWGSSGGELKLYRWNNVSNVWVQIDEYTGLSPDTRYVTGIAASWFNEVNELYILAEVPESPSEHNIIADLLDIQW